MHMEHNFENLKFAQSTSLCEIFQFASDLFLLVVLPFIYLDLLDFFWKAIKLRCHRISKFFD